MVRPKKDPANILSKPVPVFVTPSFKSELEKLCQVFAEPVNDWVKRTKGRVAAATPGTGTLLECWFHGGVVIPGVSAPTWPRHENGSIDIETLSVMVNDAMESVNATANEVVAAADAMDVSILEGHGGGSGAGGAAEAATSASNELRSTVSLKELCEELDSLKDRLAEARQQCATLQKDNRIATAKAKLAGEIITQAGEKPRYKKRTLLAGAILNDDWEGRDDTVKYASRAVVSKRTKDIISGLDIMLDHQGENRTDALYAMLDHLQRYSRNLVVTAIEYAKGDGSLRNGHGVRKDLHKAGVDEVKEELASKEATKTVVEAWELANLPRDGLRKFGKLTGLDKFMPKMYWMTNLMTQKNQEIDAAIPFEPIGDLGGRRIKVISDATDWLHKQIAPQVFADLVAKGKDGNPEPIRYRWTFDGRVIAGNLFVMVGLIPLNLGLPSQAASSVVPVAIYCGPLARKPDEKGKRYDPETTQVLRDYLAPFEAQFTQLQAQGVDIDGQHFEVEIYHSADMKSMWAETDIVHGPLTHSYCEKVSSEQAQCCPVCTGAYKLDEIGDTTKTFPERVLTADNNLTGLAIPIKRWSFCPLHATCRVSEKMESRLAEEANGYKTTATFTSVMRGVREEDLYRNDDDDDDDEADPGLDYRGDIIPSFEVTRTGKEGGSIGYTVTTNSGGQAKKVLGIHKYSGDRRPYRTATNVAFDLHRKIGSSVPTQAQVRFLQRNAEAAATAVCRTSGAEPKREQQ